MVNKSPMPVSNVKLCVLEQGDLDAYVKIGFYQTSNQFASSFYCIVCYKTLLRNGKKPQKLLHCFQSTVTFLINQLSFS